LEHGKEAFVKKEGNAEGFDKLVATAKERGAAKAKEKLMAERVNKPAPDFSAKNITGETVQLAQLKGKVVVLDFWATWCGPCKAAFPFVQKVYQKYKDNPDVVILAVNTWENEKGAEREKLVKKFLEDNQYAFPVVYDETQVVEKYKVEGIPTQFFVDRKGVIQFKTVGFEGPEAEQGMAMKIDLLLSGEQLSAK
jgi:thiol-disulfide isomerase/thioredoxin